MTAVFTGTLAIVLGLGFWLGLLAMVIGSVLGALIVSYLSTWGPRTGTGQLPNSQMAFGGGVAVPATLQWLSSIAWDALAGFRRGGPGRLARRPLLARRSGRADYAGRGGVLWL